MAEEGNKVVCGACECDPEIVTNPEGKAEAVCPRCGSRDDLEDAKRIATEHAFHEAALATRQALFGGSQSNEFVKLEPELLPQRTFKWHAVAV